MPKRDREKNPAALLGPEDGPAWRIIGDHDEARVLLVCDHASAAIPVALNQLGLGPAEFGRHIALDIGAAALTVELSASLSAPAILAGFSRLVVDCNRYPNDPTAICEVSDGTVIPGNLGLTERDRRLRMEEIRSPYHDAIAARLQRFAARDIAPAVISIHSFTPRLHGRLRPWQIGVLWDADARIAAPLMAALRATGVPVGDNQPYSGRHPADFTLDHHAEALAYPHVSIEVRQDLLSDAPGVADWAGRLTDALAPVLADPELFRPRS